MKVALTALQWRHLQKVPNERLSLLRQATPITIKLKQKAFIHQITHGVAQILRLQSLLFPTEWRAHEEHFIKRQQPETFCSILSASLPAMSQPSSDGQ
jgi:hypothetical protein